MRAREAAVQVGRDHALARSERAVVRNRGGTKKEILMNFIPPLSFFGHTNSDVLNTCKLDEDARGSSWRPCSSRRTSVPWTR
jgi:hypothetical protein